MKSNKILIFAGIATLAWYLFNNGIGAISEHAKAATAIKAELKKIYPNTKFSVKSESYSGGSSVRIHWTDGPTTKMVDNIVRKYQYGSFNGMEDIYEYDNNRDDIPQAKYVQTSRSMKNSTKEIIKMHILDTYGNLTLNDAGDFEPVYQENWRNWGSTLIYQEFNKLDLSKYKS